jgi:citrate lyase beta subunit
VLAKLRREPVEDYRIDFEDGYGCRADAEEDAHAVAAANAMKEGLAAGLLPPFCGIRIKPLAHEMRARSLRTLDLFLRTLGKPAPENFVVTLPKIAGAAEPALLAGTLDALERELRLPDGSLGMEIMIETPQAFQESNLHKFAEAGRGRVRGAHFGPFDYTSSLGIASVGQDLLHPVCDMARHLMQVAFAPTGIWISDGPTNVMPVARERGAAGVHDAWRLHFKHVRHSLYMGFYQGWDLHPAQLVSRYAAVFSFFEEALGDASVRLKSFVGRAAQATMVGQRFDDAASGQGLLNFFLRAINCGAITEAEARERTGLSHSEIAGGSFARIVQARNAP